MGLKAKKLNKLQVERKTVRYEARWLRRLINSRRRFARWIKIHKAETMAGRSWWDMNKASDRKMLVKSGGPIAVKGI
jgi:hypothetical protein